jgi:membrane protease YdiL (CAAX protease family)
MTRAKAAFLIALPGLVLPSTAAVFTALAAWLGRDLGYLLGFMFYWLFWCLLVPWAVSGRRGPGALLADRAPLFSKANWIAALLFLIVTAVTVGMYAIEFARAPLGLVLAAIPLATANGICEEILWRGVYVTAFPRNPWLAIVYPAAGFAVWHIAPLLIYSQPGGMFPFVLSAFFLGLAYGAIAYRTGSARWTALSHSLNGILALSGMLAPSVLSLAARLR